MLKKSVEIKHIVNMYKLKIIFYSELSIIIQEE
jgi:hypothetical protein